MDDLEPLVWSGISLVRLMLFRHPMQVSKRSLVAGPTRATYPST
jgi:hypothetical protein